MLSARGSSETPEFCHLTVAIETRPCLQLALFVPINAPEEQRIVEQGTCDGYLTGRTSGAHHSHGSELPYRLMSREARSGLNAPVALWSQFLRSYSACPRRPCRRHILWVRCGDSTIFFISAGSRWLDMVWSERFLSRCEAGCEAVMLSPWPLLTPVTSALDHDWSAFLHCISKASTRASWRKLQRKEGRSDNIPLYTAAALWI